MNPTLVGISGTVQGKSFEVTDETSIGRDESNKIQIGDLLASRRHCVIAISNDQYQVTDLDSMNGTLVNGIPVKRRTLQHGDRIDIGDSVFVLLLSERPAERPGLQINDSVVAKATSRLRVEDAFYLNPERVADSPAVSARIALGFSTLLKISELTASVRSAQELSQRVLRLVFGAVPAERGAVLIGKGADEIQESHAMTRESKQIDQQVLSRAIVHQVIQERVGILSNDVLENPGDAKALLAVPLLLFGKIGGVLYLDTTNPAVHFDEDHLHLANAIAMVTASALEHIRQMEMLRHENKRLQSQLDLEHSMIGDSDVMCELYHQITKAAPTDSTVLIRGESGTGKELVAQAIHRNSSRAEKPFVVVNCSALAETLLESELFGYEKGAFTGALARKQGRLEVADGGTVFLDEVGEVSPALQSKLLRVLQEKEFDRVGGTRPIQLDVRFIAATNRDLESAMKSGTFRQDLFYRLNVVTLSVPALRSRREDIPLLATYFILKHSKKAKRHVNGLSAEARACLLNYDWPGNVRELENAIERAVALGSSDTVLLEDLPESILDTLRDASAAGTQYHVALREAKKKILLLALEEAKGNYKDAAKLLGIHPNNLHRLIRNLQISRR